MNEYLEALLKQIRCKKARPYIQQEFQDHIENQIQANIRAGMDYGSAEKEAVKDMGDPIETGICLNRIHKPQIAWNLLFIIILLSIFGIIIHMMIAQHINMADAAISNQYIFHVVCGMLVMLGIYYVDYTLLARISKMIAVIFITICLLTVFFGKSVDGMTYWIFIGSWPISIQAFILFYVPIYGGIIYRYLGLGYNGLVKAIIWMIIPFFLVLMMKALMSASLMLVSMLMMLTIAIQKDWFIVNKKKTIMCIWGISITLLVVNFYGIHFENFVTLQSFFESNKFIGSNGADMSQILPSFNVDYVLTYVTSTYGIIATILVCTTLAIVIFFVFKIAIKQKNQLAVLMGCGCGMVFLLSFLINLLENFGILPMMDTFMPFISAGGSYIIVSYGLIGIILSIYRYKNIYSCPIRIHKVEDDITTQS